MGRTDGLMRRPRPATGPKMESKRTRFAPDDTRAVTGGAPPVSAAERKRRRREIWIAACALIAIAAIVTGGQWISAQRYTHAVGGGESFLVLNAVNILLIFLIVYLVGRNLVKLFFERRRGILGAHLNLKFALAFGILTTVPMTILFVVSSRIVRESIDTWFNLQIDNTLEESQRIAEHYYQSASDEALRIGHLIAAQVRDERLLREGNHTALEERIASWQRDRDLGVVQVFSATGEELVAAVNPEIPAADFSSVEGEFVARALAGEAVARALAVGGRRAVRGAVPIASTFLPDEVVGAVVVHGFTPVALAASLHSIRVAHDDYRTLQPRAGTIERAYQLELLLFSLVTLLFAVWWGFRTAKGITEPIRALAEGTAEVARGNLDVAVEKLSEDELGFLVDSFNRMTRDLKEARFGLERTNAELERRRNYMEIVLRNTGAGVLSLDADGRIQTLNPSAQRLLALAPGEELVGVRLEEVLVRSEQREILELVKRLRPGSRESQRRQIRVPRDGDLLTLLVTASLLQNEAGHVVGWVVVLDDYSQLVKVQRMQAWQEVARRIAHEIKNPLTPIQLSTQRLRRRFRARAVRDAADRRIFDECVAAITSQVEGLKILVDEFSNFARLPQADPKPDDLNRVVLAAAARYAGTEGVDFQTALDPELPPVEIDAEQFGRLLGNLIDNALAAIRERATEADGTTAGRGRVELRTVYEATLHAARLEIVDNGVGIPPEHRSTIFEPYFSTKDRGSGLGLAIGSRIVADHGGYIRAYDTPPRGTRFVIEIPAPPPATLRPRAFAAAR